MKLSYKWIKDYVDIDADPETLAERLTMTGSEVGGMEQINGDVAMELEITSNRPDCLNMLGLAREAAAIFRVKVKVPVTDGFLDASGENGNGVKCEIKEPALCPRYTARTIRDVKVGAMSGKISERLESLGMRKVNNVVDITNFCLLESGQPLHAFDLDKIKGATVEIRRARKGEKIVTLDGEERQLDPEMLVIADAETPIAIAGVMGGKRTEVTCETKNILLESAYFDPISVRRTSRSLGFSSDSSYRFERGVDKAAIKSSSRRATALILEAAGGKAEGFYDSGEYGEDKKELELDIVKAGKLLGVELDLKETMELLERLGMDVFRVSDEKLKVTVPSFREDIYREIDLIEEVARIYGYHRIPDTVPVSAPWTASKSEERKVLEKTKKLLCSMGLSEIMTYSMISEPAARNFQDLVKDEVKIMNPLSAEQEMLTPHLIDGMLKSVSWNLNRGNKDLMFFESGKAYKHGSKKEEFIEMPVLAIGTTGLITKNWTEGEKKTDIYRLKGVLENLAENLRFSFLFEPHQIDGFKNAVKISIKGKEAGFIGEVTKEKLDVYGITQNVFVAQVELGEIYRNAALRGKYAPIPRFPFSSRDISVLCDKNIAAAGIKDIIEQSGGDIAGKVDIVDMYEGKQIPPDKKSVTFRVMYGVPDRTLTDREIEETHSKIKETLITKLNVSFR